MKSKIVELLQSSNVFLTGGAGVGKSYLTREIISLYKQSAKHVIILGSTGISAVALGGQTIHSFFNFSIASSLEELIRIDSKSSSKKKLKELNEILKQSDLIVIDEISMVSSNLLDMIRYRVESSAFSGSLLFVGDFFQLPPIIKQQENSGLFDDRVYAFESEAWRVFEPVIIELKEMKRTKNREFFNILKMVRVGKKSEDVIEYLSKLSIKSDFENEPTFLQGRNIEVSYINNEKLTRLEGKVKLFEAILDKEDKKVHPKKITSWINSLPIEKDLSLKVGAPILFTYNNWGKFANGERGVVVDILDDSIIVNKTGNLIKVERREFNLTEYSLDKNGELKEESLATISQFPLKLAYAITIHKSQGMSIDSLVCNVDHIFTPSQFYVAIGRAVDPDTLFIEYRRGELRSYLKSIIRVDDRVKAFYQSNQSIIP